MEEQYKNNQSQEEIKRLQSQCAQDAVANDWRQKYTDEVASHKATQEDLAQTEVLLAEQSKTVNDESEMKYKKLEERFTNMKSKARAKIAEKDDEIRELTKKTSSDGEMFQTLTTNYKETLAKLNEKEKKVEEQEEAIAKHSSLKAKYEYKINYMEKKVEEQEEAIAKHSSLKAK